MTTASAVTGASPHPIGPPQPIGSSRSAGAQLEGHLEHTQFCRVTLVTPRRRADLALPTDLTVAELEPMLCELLGESAQPPGWCLATVAGGALPAGATLAALGVLDGDLLRLRRRDDAPPPPVFDDPVDAVVDVVGAVDVVNPVELVSAVDVVSAVSVTATGATGRAAPLALRPWDEHARRVAGLALAGAAVLAAAGLLVAARGLGPQASPVAAVVAGLAAAAALSTAAHTVRLDQLAATVLCAAAVPLAAACGVAALPGNPGVGHVLLAAALATATAAAGSAVLATPAPVLVGAGLVGSGVALTALLGTFGVGSGGGLAALAGAAAVALLPLLARASVRLAGLPAPVVPTTPEELFAADAQWRLDSDLELRHRCRLAHGYLGGLVLGGSVLAAGGAVVAGATGGLAGQLFGATVAAVLLLRTRAYGTLLPAAAPLGSGMAAAAGLLVVTGGTGLGAGGPDGLGSSVCTGVALALVIAGSTAVSRVCGVRGQDASPIGRRALDMVEAALVVATFPLALWVLDLYHAVQGL